MKPYLFKIGGFELRIYSLMYILAFLCGIFIGLADDVAEKRGITDRKIIEDFAFATILAMSCVTHPISVISPSDTFSYFMR